MSRSLRWILFCAWVLSPGWSWPVMAQVLDSALAVGSVQVKGPDRLILGKEYRGRDKKRLSITFLGPKGQVLESLNAEIRVTSAGFDVGPGSLVRVKAGRAVITDFVIRSGTIKIHYGGVVYSHDFAVASWWSLGPPVCAIVLALLFRQVLIALFGGIWFGQVGIQLTRPDLDFDRFLGQFFGLLPALSETLVGELVEPDHAKTILFTFLMGGMIGIVSKAGGMRAIVEVIAGYARTPRSAQLATWLMGLCIFFDDYANTILVGSTMRPFTDRFRISREKLAFLVDCTAAPVASLFLISTWIGYEVGLIAEMLEVAQIDRVGYRVFVESVPYRFYSIFCLFMVFVVALSKRDFGPMLVAERRARLEGKVVADGARPMLNTGALEGIAGESRGHWAVAAIPVGVMIVVVFVGLYVTGQPRALVKAGEQLSIAERVLGISGVGLPFEVRLASVQGALAGGETNLAAAKAFESVRFHASFSGIFSAAAAYDSLIWGAGLGVLAAGLLGFGGGFLTLAQCCEAFMDGLRAMLLAVVVLVLAWGLGRVCDDLLTGAYLAEAVRFVPVWLLPALVFVMSALIAFCTGTSWGTMAIIFPVLGPLLGLAVSEVAFESILLGSVGAVLAGACFGDHASPISDTTILSSMASGADHLDHVKTQFPYAITCGAIAILVGFLPAGFGFSPFIGLVIGAGVIACVFWFFGVEAEAAA